MIDNLERRIKEHRRGKGGKFTRSFKVHNLLYYESYPTKSQALRRETQIKGWTRRKKFALIKGDLELLKRL
ncbi:MAG: GIY-YIG nuclease family protein [Candidatus Omnitrophota bacterium]|nr:MAG: GIY-YIG nuclease family protein [Candidatus Omnitrophota bacterium]